MTPHLYFVGCNTVTAPCPAGYRQDGSNCVAIPPPVAQPDVESKKILGDPEACEGNPCDPATGNKFLREIDYTGSGLFPLRIVRHYNSLDYGYSLEQQAIRGRFGPNWISNFDVFASRYVLGGNSYATLRLATGKRIHSQQVDGLWTPDADISFRFPMVPWESGLVVIDEDDNTLHFEPGGKLARVTNRAGLQQTYSYDTSGRVETVGDSFGRTLAFTYYGTSNRIHTITVPGGGVYQYEYDTSERLERVTYPDMTARRYVYGEFEHTGLVSQPYLLTGIYEHDAQDATGTRFATYDYAPNSKVVGSTHFGGAGSITLDYQTNSITEVTDALDAIRTYQFEAALGVKRATSLLTECGSGSCAGTSFTESWDYDANGNVDLHADPNGNLTDYTFDLGRNLETQRIEGLATGGAQTADTRYVSTDWHPAFRLPTIVAEPKRITSYQYEGSTGRPTLKSIQVTSDESGASGTTPPGDHREPPQLGLLLSERAGDARPDHSYENRWPEGSADLRRHRMAVLRLDR